MYRKLNPDIISTSSTAVLRDGEWVLNGSKQFITYIGLDNASVVLVTAGAVGLAQACMDEALLYAKQRTQFGQSIFDFQAVQFKLADMAVAIELARNQYLKAAWLKDQGRGHTFEAAAAQLFASEMAEKAASEALQIHGGYGFMTEYPVSRYYKSAKVLQIVEGTSEVQRMIIGRALKG